MNEPKKNGDDPSISALLLRVLARGLTPPHTLVTRDEAMELLPPCCSRHWFDENVKGKQVAFVGERSLYRWGDVTAALVGKHTTTVTGATGAERYLTVAEAATYLRYPSTNALRMALLRKQILPSARRGRMPLFTREDLDRQVARRDSRGTDEADTAEPAATTTEEPHALSNDPPRRSPATEKRRSDTDTYPRNADDPFGLRAAMARGRGEPWPPPPKKGRKSRRR